MFPHSDLYVTAGDLNSGPLACEASKLINQAISPPINIIFYKEIIRAHFKKD